MPAKIIQPNSEPFKKVDIDPITLDIIESALRSARYEMDAVLYRTAMSPGIREQHDEFPMIASPNGKMVVGQFGSFIHGFNRDYDGTIEEGSAAVGVWTYHGEHRVHRVINNTDTRYKNVLVELKG